MTGIHEAVHPFLASSRGDIALDVAITTLLAIVVLSASRLPSLSPRTRHAMLLVALAKFVVPVWAVAAGLSAIGARLPATLQRVSEAAGEGTIWIGLAAGPAPKVSHTVCVAALVWVVVAAALVTVQLHALHRARAIARRAERAPTTAQTRLDHARERAGIRGEVRLATSGEVSTPCVVRQGGITLLLPAGVDYDPEELGAVFAHELAHVHRGDLAMRAIAGIVAAMSWPNPIVWMVRRRLFVEAESACDAEAIAATRSVDTYLGAIRKSILPGGRGDAVAGMMGSGLAERLRRMPMNGKRFWNHGLTLFACLSIVAAVTVVAAAPPAERDVAAAPGELVTDGSLLSIASGDIGRYGVFVNVRGIRNGQLLINMAVKDKDSGALISAPRIVTMPHEPAEVRSGYQMPDGNAAEMKAAISVDADGNGSVELEWIESGVTVERGTIKLRADEAAASYDFLRKPFQLSVKDAKIGDVLTMFGQLTGFEVQMPADLRHDVTLELHDVPFEDVLDQVLEQAGATWYLDGKTIVVAKSR